MRSTYLGLFIGSAVILLLFYISPGNEKQFLIRHPKGVMGTTCTIAAQYGELNKEEVSTALQAAENVIRDIEAKMSNWIDESEISRFNRGENTRLSPDTTYVLLAAFQAHQKTLGAFDITCRPLIELWKERGKSNIMPSGEEIQNALHESNWQHFVWEQNRITKNDGSARVDLGGIAKGYAIDLAIDTLQTHKIKNGMIDIGGDLRFYNHNDNEVLTIHIKHPFKEGIAAQAGVTDAAVCTSGNYARYIEIGGKRFSHIIDPRTGLPADVVPSVTVLSDRALQGDIWATAISVLGKEGITILPKDIDAFLILGDEENTQYLCTEAFAEKLLDPKPHPLEIIARN